MREPTPKKTRSRLTPELLLSIVIVAIAGYVLREGSLFANSHGWLDSLLIVAALLLILWLMWPRKRDGV